MAFWGRGKNKYRNPLKEGDAYKDYIKGVDKGSPYDITLKEYREICYAVNKEIARMIIDEGDQVRLPNIGTFDIVKFKVRYGKSHWIPTDFKKSEELGMRILNLNEHTNGYKYVFRWSKRGVAIIRGVSKYKFISTRRNKRYLAYILNNRIRDYFEKD